MYKSLLDGAKVKSVTDKRQVNTEMVMTSVIIMECHIVRVWPGKMSNYQRLPKKDLQMPFEEKKN